MVDARSKVTTFEYDTADRRTATVDPAGNRVEWTLDAAGNARSTTRTEVLSAGGTVTTSMSATFDAVGRARELIDPLGNRTSTHYDARGNAIRVVDPEGHFTHSTYDGLDRLVRTVRPEGISVDYGYDRSGRLRTYRDALNQTTTYGYDALDRRRSTIYPDTRTETVEYDAAGNPTTLVDGLGTVVVQQFDDANRLAARTVTPAEGVEGPLSETFAYDGLSRLRQAVSGGIATTLAYDSLSRLTSETTNGRTVSFEHDATGNRTLERYPSGLDLVRTFDDLNRPQTVGPASYGYRGPDLVASKSRHGIDQTLVYDAARRLIEAREGSPSGDLAHLERIAWTARSLKAAMSRSDVPGSSLVLGYDGAGRLTRSANLPDLAATIPNNSTPPAGVFDEALRAQAFAYDSAENLLARTTTESGIAATTSLPLDGSGRNRPGSIDGVALEWDGSGNLVRKGDLELHYDFRNRLTRVTRGSLELARYRYDAFNRKIESISGGETRETVWSGWQPIETRGSAGFSTRRIYGVGLDEIVRQEVDIDGDGTAETAHLPIYDSTGSLVAILDEEGRPIERYEYTPYGQRTIRADLTAPEIEQVRVVDGDVSIEVSERINFLRLLNLVTTGEIRFENLTTSTEVEITGIEQPVTLGLQAGRRFVLELEGPPAAGDAVRLVLPAGAFEDSFLNANELGILQTWTWTGLDEVILDTRAPEIAEVRIRSGRVEIELTEEVDPQSANTAVTIDGAQTGWELLPDRYTLRSILGVSPLSHTVAIAPGIQDLAGTIQPQTLNVAFPAGAADRLGYRRTDPNEIPTSSAANAYGFHGHEVDPATGLVYMRNRWYDPEMGRFVTADPLGHVDGPSAYGLGLNDPANRSDPLGLYQTDFHFYAVYYMAWLALTDASMTETIALSSQFTDEHYFTSPIPPTRSGIHEPHYWKRLRAFHFVSSSFGPTIRDNSLARSVAYSAIDRSSPVALGIALHSLADTYSHEGFSAYPGPTNWRNSHLRAIFDLLGLASVGHIEALEEPDLPHQAPEAADKAAEAALNIYEMVWELGRQLGRAKPKLSGNKMEALRNELRDNFLSFAGANLESRTNSWFFFLRLRGVPVPFYTKAKALSRIEQREFAAEALKHFQHVESNSVATVP